MEDEKVMVFDVSKPTGAPVSVLVPTIIPSPGLSAPSLKPALKSTPAPTPAPTIKYLPATYQHFNIIPYLLCFFSVITFVFALIWVCLNRLSLSVFLALCVAIFVSLLVNLWIIYDTNIINDTSGDFYAVERNSGPPITRLLFRYFIGSITWRQIITLASVLTLILWYVNTNTSGQDDYYVFMSVVIVIVLLSLLHVVNLDCKHPIRYT